MTNPSTRSLLFALPFTLALAAAPSTAQVPVGWAAVSRFQFSSGERGWIARVDVTGHEKPPVMMLLPHRARRIDEFAHALVRKHASHQQEGDVPGWLRCRSEPLHVHATAANDHTAH